MAKTVLERVLKSQRKKRMLDLALERLTAACNQVEADGDVPVVTHIDRRDGLRLDWQFHPVVYEVMKDEAAAMKLSVDEFIAATMKSKHAVGKVHAMALTASPGKLN